MFSIFESITVFKCIGYSENNKIELYKNVIKYLKEKGLVYTYKNSSYHPTNLETLKKNLINQNNLPYVREKDGFVEVNVEALKVSLEQVRKIKTANQLFASSTNFNTNINNLQKLKIIRHLKQNPIEFPYVWHILNNKWKEVPLEKLSDNISIF